jgi:hypothetical protein
MKHAYLIETARQWLAKPWRNASNEGHGACSVIITDMTSAARETPDALGWHSFGQSTLVECKISLDDFRSDQQKFFRAQPSQGVGDWRYYMAPKGLISTEILPNGWGLIEVNDKGKTRVVRISKKFEANKSAENDMLLSLLRRLRVEPGRHVKIRAYNIDDLDKEPRATVTMDCASEGDGDDA